MGLLDLLLKNQSNLDINPVPPQGNGPIAPATGEFNTGTTPFQQVWDSTNTYINNFNPNIQPDTLGQTGLDNTNPNFVPSTTLPSDNTTYPNLATGEYNSVSNQYNQIYTPNSTYLNTFNPNVQPNNLANTGLDIENIGLVSTTAAPSTNTTYPNLSSGEFGGQSNNFNQVYTPNSTYLNTFNPQTQPNTIIQGQTGLDNINPLSAPTTTTPNTPTNYPNQSTGEFGGVSTQYNPPYGPNSTYENIYVNSPINFDTLQTTTLDETGLDNTNPIFTPTTTTPVDPTQYPQYTQGEFNGIPTLYNQLYNPNSNYLNAFIAGGSIGIQPQTLPETGLDVDNPNFVPTTTTPSTITQYPAIALGGLGQSAVQFLQIWSPVITYNNVVVGAGTSPLAQSLPETGLDNTDLTAVPTTVSPINTTNYPNQSTGEFGGVSTQYSTIYSPNQTYENIYINNPVNFDTLQSTTLDETGLDNTNPNFLPTTLPPVDSTQYPQYTQGEFNGVPTLYNQVWGPGFKYIANFNPNIQPNTLGQTGLDNTNPAFVPTTAIPSTFTSYPQFTQGEFNGVPTQFSQIWDFNNKYIVNFNPNIQPNTLSLTGLDIENQNAAPTTAIPSTITQYPQFAQGEFNTAPNQYSQIWGPTNQYIVNFNPNIQPSTLSQTGLDVEDPTFVPTTTTPSTITQYPAISTGEFGGVSTQYTQIWNPNNTYDANFNPNIQPNTLGQTGLDVDDQNFVPTTTTPSTVTQYPLFVQGEFNTAPNQYSQIWGPTNQYVINYNPNIQPNTVNGGETGLDNTNPLAFNTTFVPNVISAPTIYPQPAQTFLGEFNGAPSQFTPLYTPNPGQSYLDSYNTIVNNTSNPQISTLTNTGLDVEEAGAAPTTYVVPGIDNTTIYPSQVTGEYNGAPSPFGQTYTPN